jgi:hypothetical protein
VLLTPPNNLSAVSLTSANSFSALSLTPTKNFRLFGYFPVTRRDAGDKFFAGVIAPLNSLLPVSLTPAINIHSRISPRIFEKIQNGPNGILGGLGDTDSRKKPEVENLVSDSL